MTLSDAAYQATSAVGVENSTRWRSVSPVDEGIKDSTSATTRVIRNLYSPSFMISPESTISPLRVLLYDVTTLE